MRKSVCDAPPVAVPPALPRQRCPASAVPPARHTARPHAHSLTRPVRDRSDTPEVDKPADRRPRRRSSRDARLLAVLGVIALVCAIAWSASSPDPTPKAPEGPVAIQLPRDPIVGVRLLGDRVFGLTAEDRGVAIIANSADTDLVAESADWSVDGAHLVVTLGQPDASDERIAAAIDIETGTVTTWTPLGPVSTVGHAAVSASATSAQRTDLRSGQVSRYTVSYPTEDAPTQAAAIAPLGDNGVLVATTPRNAGARHPGALWRTEPGRRPVKLGPILATNPPFGLATHPSHRWVAAVEASDYGCSPHREQPLLIEVATGSMLRPLLPALDRPDASTLVHLAFDKTGALVGQLVESTKLRTSVGRVARCEPVDGSERGLTLGADGEFGESASQADISTRWRPQPTATGTAVPASAVRARLRSQLTGSSVDMTRRGLGVLAIGVPPSEVSERTGAGGLTFNWDYLEGRHCFWARPASGDLGVRVLVVEALIGGVEATAPGIKGPGGMEIGAMPAQPVSRAPSGDGSTLVTTAGVTARINSLGVVDRLTVGNMNCPGESAPT